MNDSGSMTEVVLSPESGSYPLDDKSQITEGLLSDIRTGTRSDSPAFEAGLGRAWTGVYPADARCFFHGYY